MFRAYLVTLIFLPAMSFADGHADASAGKDNFRKCQGCHVVRDDAGNVLAGKAGRTGPNLYSVIGRQAGSLPGFRYQKSMKQAGEAGLIWSQEQLVEYLQGPTDFLKDFLDDKRARAGMSFKFRKEQDARDMAAFLASLPSR